MIIVRRAAALTSLLALSTACIGPPNGFTGNEPPSATPSTATPSETATPPASPTADSSPTCTPAFFANTLPDTETPTGPQLGLASAASAGHPGYDRVVFTFGASSAQPGWKVEYVPTAISDGSGEPVALNGPKILHVVMKDTGIEGDTGVPDPTVKRFSPTSTVAVKEVVLDTQYEGTYTAFIGVDATRPFRVIRLASPPRVVVDVRTC